MPGATVTALNEATGLRRASTSNSEGYYAIPALPPGPYRLTAELSGFASSIRRGLVLVADVRHQDRVIGPLDRTRHLGARLREELEGLPLTVHPDAALDLAAEPRLLLEGDADAPLLDPLAVAVHPLVSEVAPIERVVRLQGEQALAGGRWIPAAEVDGCLLAALDRSDDRGDEPLVEEVLEPFIVQRGCLLGVGCGYGIRVPGDSEPEG